MKITHVCRPYSQTKTYNGRKYEYWYVRVTYVDDDGNRCHRLKHIPKGSESKILELWNSRYNSIIDALGGSERLLAK